MDPWVWLAAYLVGFALLQVLLYRRFRRNLPRGETTASGAHEGAGAPSPTGGEVAAEGTVACRHCGAPNEAEANYSYCRECCEPLG